jgi:hypothetical protein
VVQVQQRIDQEGTCGLWIISKLVKVITAAGVVRNRFVAHPCSMLRVKTTITDIAP